ncbi:MAG: ATP phosphoribosyltransferase regulatory subunit [Sphingomonadaceae bacterium]
MTNGLLPEGLRDRLPPQAASLSSLLRAVLDCVGAHGYDLVSPPLAEFEEELVGRLKSARSRDLLRFVDPVSQRTLALRPDITAQIGRIATTRMAHAARPLRLSYGGPVLKLRATQLRPERELVQAGAELIGSDSITAVTEIMRIAIESLAATGVTGITLDVTLPDLVDALAAGPWPVAPERIEAIKAALDAKDAGALGDADAVQFMPLLSAAGPLPAALAVLRGLGISDLIEERLSALESIAVALPDVRITLDPTERHGFEYQSWIGFSLFGDGLSGEAGRGGSYTIVHEDRSEEPAVGFSLYLDPLVDAGLLQGSARRLFVPLGSDTAVAAHLRGDGWITVAAIAPTCRAEALGCTHWFDGDRPTEL